MEAETRESLSSPSNWSGVRWIDLSCTEHTRYCAQRALGRSCFLRSRSRGYGSASSLIISLILASISASAAGATK